MDARPPGDAADLRTVHRAGLPGTVAARRGDRGHCARPGLDRPAGRAAGPGGRTGRLHRGRAADQRTCRDSGGPRNQRDHRASAARGAGAGPGRRARAPADGGSVTDLSGHAVASRARRNLRVRILRSGSAGNAILLEAAGTRLLIDAGIPLDVIARELAPFDLTLSDLTAVLLTHEHDDHARSVGALARAAGIPVLANEHTLQQAANFLVAHPTKRFTTGTTF